MKKLFILGAVQGIYFLATAIWPFIDIRSFMWITGPKYDVWLVHTVAILIMAVAFSILYAVRKGVVSKETIVLAISSASALGFIETFYALNHIISKVYLIDAAIEAVFIILWIWFYKRLPHDERIE